MWEAFLKWGTILVAAVLGIYWWGRAMFKHGKVSTNLANLKAGDNAQEKQHRTFRRRLGGDLTDDLERVRRDGRSS